MYRKFRLLGLFIFLFNLQIAKAQKSLTEIKNPVDSIGCSAKYDKAKAMYAQMFNSSNAVKYRKLKKKFYDKVPKGELIDDPKAINCKERALFWIEANISKTGFKKYEDAQQQWDDMKEARKMLESENQELYNYIKESHKVCPELFNNFFLDLMKEYGDEFQL